MTTPALLATMTAALLAAYPDEAWLVRDAGRLIKIELPHGTHTLCGYVSWVQARADAEAAVVCGRKLMDWRESERAS